MRVYVYPREHIYTFPEGRTVSKEDLSKLQENNKTLEIQNNQLKAEVERLQNIMKETKEGDLTIQVSFYYFSLLFFYFIYLFCYIFCLLYFCF